MEDKFGRRSEKYPAPCRKSKRATGLEGRQPPCESPVLPVVLSCFPKTACQNPSPLDLPKLSQSPRGPPGLWRLASAGLPGKPSQRLPRWGAGRAPADSWGLLLTFSLAEVPSLASCELAGSGGMMRGWLGKMPSPLFLCGFGKESWWLSEEALSLSLRGCKDGAWVAFTLSNRDVMALGGRIPPFLPRCPAPHCHPIPSVLCIRCCS